MSPIKKNQDQQSNVFVYSHHAPPPQSQMVSSMPSMPPQHEFRVPHEFKDHDGTAPNGSPEHGSRGVNSSCHQPHFPTLPHSKHAARQGQGVTKREVITGGNPIMLHSHGIPLQHAGEGVPPGVNHASSGGLVNIALHGQQGPMSPASSAPSNPHSIQSQPGGYNWSYSQPVLLGDGYPHHMLPTMQASSSQAQGFFKPF